MVKKFNIQFNNGISYSMYISDHVLSLNLLQVERYAQTFKIKNDKIEYLLTMKINSIFPLPI